MYRPTHVLTHRLGMLNHIYVGTVYIASLLNKNADGTFHFESVPSSLAICLASGVVFGLATITTHLHSDVVQSGQLEDPLQWDFLLVAAGVIVSFYNEWVITKARGAYRTFSALGVSAGGYIGVTCYDKKILFYQPPEDDVLDESVKVFTDNDELLMHATGKIREIQTELTEMEHPYGSGYLPKSDQNPPVQQSLYRRLSHDASEK